MKLSIIIISYNEEKYIVDAIKSCLNQKCNFDYEIIIGDDGSNDGSIDVIKEYSEKYPDIIKYFIMDRENVSDVIPSIRVSNVIKRACSIAKGEYITILSGDDLFVNENKFNLQVNFLDNNSKYSSCYTDFKKFWNDGTEENCIYKGSDSRAIFWSGKYVHISCFMFRKDCVNNILNNAFLMS